MELITLNGLHGVGSGVDVFGVPGYIYTLIYSFVAVMTVIGIGLAGFAGRNLLRHGIFPNLVFIGGFGLLLIAAMFIVVVYAIPATPPEHWLVRAEANALVINCNPVFSRAMHSKLPGDAPSCIVLPYKNIESFSFTGEQVTGGGQAVEYLDLKLRPGTGNGLGRFLAGLKQARRQAAAQLSGMDAVEVFIAPVSNPAADVLRLQGSGYYKPELGKLYTLLRSKGLVHDPGPAIEAPDPLDLRSSAGARYLTRLVEMNQVDKALELMGGHRPHPRMSPRLDALAKLVVDGTPPDLSALQQPPLAKGVVESTFGGTGPVAYFGMAFFGFIILVGLSCAVFGAQTLRLASQSNGWSTAEGVITASTVVSYRTGGRSSRDPGSSTVPAVVYRFVVQGKEYEAETIAFCHKYFGDLADAYVKVHPVGSPVMVRFQPDNPANACLEPGVPAGLFAHFVSAAILIAMGVVPPYLMYLHGQGRLMM